MQDEPDITVEELREYRSAGGTTVVDMELPGIGRNVNLLKDLSRRSEVTIIASTGWYVASSHPAEVAAMSVEQLRDHMLSEILDGIEGTDVRAGNIGEIGLSGGRTFPFYPPEERVLRAAARAQAMTGLPLTVHPNRDDDYWDVYVDILEEEGADLSKCYMSHLGYWDDLSVAQRILDRGVGFISYDAFGMEEYRSFETAPGDGLPRDADEVRIVADLVERGYADRVLLSNQCGFKTSHRAYGGWGYSHVQRDILPWLQALGVSQADTYQMMVTNPARLFGQNENHATAPEK